MTLNQLAQRVLVVIGFLVIMSIGVPLAYRLRVDDKLESAPISVIEERPPSPISSPTQTPPQHQPLTTINEIFEPKNSIASNSALNDEIITVLATGDVLTARSVNSKMVRYNDFTWPFHHTADVLKQADLTFINLETPLIENCPLREDGMLFCGDLRAVEGLQFAGVDVVNLANNHMGNHGLEGTQSTIEHLQKNGLTPTGFDGPSYVTVKGTRIAFLGYNEVDIQAGVAPAEPSLIAQEIATAKANADIVIVQFHWGQEYTYQQTTRQKNVARVAIDAGADLIIGNHPHWFQPFEFYNGKLITYSHGNFIFDQMWSTETRMGIVGKYSFANKKLVGVEILPMMIHDYGQPRWLEGDEKSRVIDTLRTESQKLVN